MPKAWKKTDNIKFVSGNPLNEQTEGIVHLFTKLVLFHAHFFRPSKSSANPKQSSEMLCILGIPCSITVKDLLDFISPMRF